MAQATPASTLENLSRLASKPGVQSTLVLSKADGSIIRSSGLLASAPSSTSNSQSPTFGGGSSYSGEPNNVVKTGAEDGAGAEQQQGNTAEDVARMVFSFMSGANVFAEGLDKGDEVKLLRMRTRKNEIVIVPDAKFLLVVIHDTPPA